MRPHPSRFVVLAACLLAPALSSAQSLPVPAQCDKEVSNRACGGFWITETGVAIQVVPSARRGSFFPSFEAGRMVTVGPRLGLGAVGFFGWNDGARFGVKVRGRWWLDEHFSLVIAPGMQLAGSIPEGGTVPAFMSHAGLNYRDMISLSIHQESYDDISGSQTNYFAGLAFGAKPGRIALVVGGVVVLVGGIVFLASVEN